MPDIMMCPATNCPKAETCYRNEASGTRPDQYRQSFWDRNENSPIGDACPHYWRAMPKVKAAQRLSTSA